MSSAHDSPPRIVPQRGQVAEHDAETSPSESWDVLHEDVARSYLPNHPRHLSPEPAFGSALDAGAASGERDVLAWKPARYEVNSASPRASVKRPNVVPDRERGKRVVVLACDKYASSVGVELDGADSTPSEEVPSEYAPTSTREKSQLT